MAAPHIEIRSDSLIVATSHPWAPYRSLLESTSPDSFAAWGVLHAHFEQKVALEPLRCRADAAKCSRRIALQSQFHERLRHGPDPSPAIRPRALEFFRRRHDSWDERYNCIPLIAASLSLPRRLGGLPSDPQLSTRQPAQTVTRSSRNRPMRNCCRMRALASVYAAGIRPNP